MLPSYHPHPGELDSYHPAVLSLVCSPADGAYAYATLVGGAHVKSTREVGGPVCACAGPVTTPSFPGKDICVNANLHC